MPPAQYKELGEADCKKCSFLLFDVIPIKFDTMPKRAFTCAVEKMGGNDMVSTSVEESWYFIPIAGLIRCTKISGMVVKTQ